VNKAQFINYIDNPDKLTVADGVAIAGLLKDFPYFQTAHLLYAKALHNHNDISYNNQLKIAAANAADRKVLHKLITKQVDKTEEKEFVISSPKEIVKEVVTEIAAAPALEEVVREIVKEELLEKKIADEIEIPVLETVSVEEEISLTPEINIPVKENYETKTDRTEAELQKEYLNEIVNEALIYDVLALERLPIPEIEVEPEIAETKSEEIISSPEKDVVTVDEESLNFTDWLKYVNEGKDVHLSHESDNAKKADEPKEFNPFDLIDKFIKEEPRITKPKAEFYNPVNFAKQSVEDDITLVTETLAKIFLEQGNYPKALLAYENLNLKYPEKKLYFAAQIKKIKKLINQQKQ